MFETRGSILFVLAAAAIFVGGTLLQRWSLDHHEVSQVIYSPTEIGGEAVTRAQIDAFEAELASCHAAGRRCLIVIEQAYRGERVIGWLPTPTPGR